MVRRLAFPALAAAALTLASACAVAPTHVAAHDEAGVGELLDAWHAAAARADGAAYFGALSADAVFLGTDASERWSREAFRGYAEPHFSQGRGWTYRPFDRHLAFSPDGRTAWVDEKLANDKYGELRGTGVLRREPAGWRIVHYSMSFPIPNEVTLEVVELVRTQVADPRPRTRD